MILLAAYNNEPWDVDKANITLAELFSLWLERKAPKTSPSTLSMMKSAYNHCAPLHKQRYVNIKAYHMQGIIDNCGYGYGAQNHIKTYWRHIGKFALELDIITRNYAPLLTSAPAVQTSKRKLFADEEIMAMWAMQGQAWVDSVLFLLYTGFRISEMLALRKENIDLENGIITGGTKTKAGKDRKVPIHSKIRHIVEARMQEDGEYLFSYKGKQCGDKTYRVFWQNVMDTAGIQHTPHECRHSFRSRLDSAGANKKCIDLMMGHQTGDVGERFYTHKTFAELKTAIELLAA